MSGLVSLYNQHVAGCIIFYLYAFLFDNGLFSKLRYACVKCLILTLVVVLSL